jgi:hypothetical protein
LAAFEGAVEAFERGGSRSEYMAALLALGMPAGAVRYLAEYPGRTMMVRASAAICRRKVRNLKLP